MSPIVASSSGWWILALAITLLNVAGAVAVLSHARKSRRAPAAGRASFLRPAPSMPPQSDPEEIRALVTRLWELATSTACNVGEHSTRVQRVNAQLAASAAADEGPVRQLLVEAAKQMMDANRKLEAELAEARAELQDHTRLIEVHMAEARTDALAGIANRRALDEELARRYAAWQRQGTPLSLMIVDVDHFKRLNDTHGHQAGDEVLRGIGRVLAATVRDMDFVARYGGEEFAFVLPDTRLEDAKSAAERIRKAIAAARFPFAGEDLHVTVSVGLAEIQRGDTVASLLRHADTALYAAKTNGRNRSYFHHGTGCFPVDAAGVAARSEAARAVHQRLVEADCQLWSTNRRAHARSRFNHTQSIAPCVNGQIPAPDAFHDVLCRDLACSGFSFWLPAPPDYSSLVVAFRSDGAVKHVLAEVVHSTPVQHNGQTAYLVGCRFTSRVDLNGEISGIGENDA